ncbi:MAG TPA: hypothetical protein VIX86_12545 [Streptosporangiaceae bacterium]
MAGVRDRVLAQLRKEDRAAGQMYRRHRQLCFPCTASTASGNTAGLCDIGWQLAKVATRAGHAVRARQHEQAAGASGQGRLF